MSTLILVSVLLVGCHALVTGRIVLLVRILYLQTLSSWSGKQADVVHRQVGADIVISWKKTLGGRRREEDEWCCGYIF